MRLTPIAVLGLTILHCSGDSRLQNRGTIQEHMNAARTVTRDCAGSRLADWNIRASAAGSDCAVLLIETPVILEDAVIVSIHYGTRGYGVFQGGVNQFSREKTFRGVAYKDGSGQLWFYGNLSRTEAEALRPCR